jgi:hypothetical protein
MTLTARTRKLLWGSAGGRCAICRRLLTEGPATSDGAIVVGEECHIVSARPDGPRYRPLDAAQINAYDNLILLCPSDHAIVDKQPLHHTEEWLVERKSAHEEWVRTLSSSVDGEVRIERSTEPVVVELAQHGRELMAAAGGAHAAEVMTPELSDHREADIVGGFLQTVQDWGELWDEIPIAERLRVELDLTTMLAELREAGFVVYCGERRDAAKGGVGRPSLWNVAILHVFRADDPVIAGPGRAADAAPESQLASTG